MAAYLVTITAVDKNSFSGKTVVMRATPETIVDKIWSLPGMTPDHRVEYTQVFTVEGIPTDEDIEDAANERSEQRAQYRPRHQY